MASGDKIEVSLDFMTAGATKALDGLSKNVTSTFSKMGTGVGKVGGKLGDMTKSLFSVQTAVISAGTAFVTYLGSKQVLDKAIAQEEAVNSISLALARTNSYSKQALKGMEDWASALQQSTVYGDEQIINQASIAMAFGASADQAKLMTEAAIELSAATGKSLEESTRQLSKTLGGFAGELGEVNPRIKALTAEQLKAGDAAKLLLEQYGGTATGNIKTFSGALTQNKNIFGDLLEEIGFLITKNPMVIDGIRAMSGAFTEMGNYLKENREEIIRFINEGLVKVVSYAPQVGNAFKVLVEITTALVKSLALATSGLAILLKSLLEFKIIKSLFDGIVYSIGQVVGGLADLLSLLVQIPAVSGTLKAMGVDAEALSVSLDKAAKASYNALEAFSGDTAIKGLEVMEEIGFSITESADNIKNGINKNIDAGVKKAQELANVMKGISGKGQVEVEVVNNKDSVKASIDSYQQLLEVSFGGANGAKIGGALIQGITSGLKGGAEGARQMLSSVAGAAADAFLPGLGAAVGPLVDVLSQGPEAVRQMVKDFAGAIPDLITAIIEAIPVLIEELALQIPIVIERLAENADKVIDALIEALPGIVSAIIAAIPKIITSIIKMIPKVIASFISTLIKETPKLISALVEGIWEAVKDLLGFGDGGLLSSAGAGLVGSTENGSGIYGATVKGYRDVEREISGFFEKAFGWKFAKGGEVPNGFPNDTLPARLSSGEYVIDRGLTKDLKKMVKEGDQNVTNALLSKMINLLEKPQVVQSSVKMNQREFANIILQLNRTNQRMA